MSAQQGLSIFDGAETGGFAVVLRGYDRIQVETHIRKLESALADALNRSARGEVAASQVSQLKRDLAAAQQRLSEAGNPTYGGLGDHVAQLLHTAEGQAHDLVAQARAEAEATLLGAREEAQAAVTAARQEAESTITSARSEAAATREAAATAARRLRDETKQVTDNQRRQAAEEAGELLAAAQRAAHEIRRLADQDAGLLRESTAQEARTLSETTRRDIVERREAVDAACNARIAAAEREIGALRQQAEDEVEALRTTAVALLNDSRRRAAEEVTILETALDEVRRRIAAVQVPGAPVLRESPGPRETSGDAPRAPRPGSGDERSSGGSRHSSVNGRHEATAAANGASAAPAVPQTQREPHEPPLPQSRAAYQPAEPEQTADGAAEVSSEADDATQMIPVTRHRVA